MLKKFFSIQKKYRYIGAAVLVVIVGLACVLIFTKGPPAEDAEVAPTGESGFSINLDSGEQPSAGNESPASGAMVVPAGLTDFSINLDIIEAEPYAGIEFALTLSDENALEFASFTPGLDGASASPFMTKDGLHFFGFYTISGENIFPGGEAMVGVLSFEGYTGGEELTVSIVQMNVTRLNEEKQSVTTEKDVTGYVFTIARQGG